MFNIKNLVNRIADRSQQREGDGNSPPGRSDSLTDEPNGQAAEGFLCPSCMQSFSSPVELQTHYESNHMDSEISRIREEETMPTRNVEIEGLKKEVAELQLNLKEEKWYSDELKREVEKLQTAVVGSGDADSNSNASLKSDMDVAAQLRMEKENMEQRAANIATENVALKAAVDELSGEKMALMEQVRFMESQLAHRNSTDDAAVLRQELVQVQRMMDQLTLEREEERDKLQSELQNLQDQYQLLQVEKLSLAEMLNQSPNQSEMDRLQDVMKEMAAAEKKDEISSLEIRIQELQKEVNSNQGEAASNREKLALLQNILDDREACVKALEKDLDESLAAQKSSEFSIASLTEKVSQLEDSSDSAMKDMSRVNSDLTSQLTSLKELLHSKEGHLTDLSSQLSQLQGHYYEQCQANDEAKTHVWEKQQALEEEQRTRQGRESQLKDLEGLLAQEKEQVQRLEKEKVDLLAMIEEGEGVSVAIQQLQGENTVLKQRVEDAQKQASAQKKGLDEKLDKLHHSLQETKLQLQQATSRAENLESNLTSTTEAHSAEKLKSAQLEGELKSKVELLTALEAAKNSLKLDMEKQIHSMQGNLKEQIARAEKLSKELGQQKEASSNWEAKAKEAEKRCKSAEESTKARTAELQKLEIELHTFRSQSVATQKRIDELEGRIKEKEKQEKAMHEEESLLNGKIKEYEIMQQKLEVQRVEMKSQLEEKIKELTLELKHSQSDKKKLDEAMAEMKEQDEKIAQKMEEMRKTITNLTEAKTNAEHNLVMSQREVQELQVIKESLDNHVEDITRKKTSLEEDKRRLQKALEEESTSRKSMEEKLSSLTEAKQLLISQKVEVQSKLESLQETFSRKCAALEAKLREEEEEKNSLLSERNSFMESMETESGRRKSLESQIGNLETRHEVELANLREELKAVKAEALTMEEVRTKIQTTLDELTGSKLELEAKLENALDERRSLLERCLGSESEGEKMRATMVELRRKLEDCQAALHELGRENQTLQMENAKIQGRKWADDSAVHQCTGCTKEFSVMIRKHHCRNCGQIFCNECSSKTAPMHSSKKPVRVCEKCYLELTDK